MNEQPHGPALPTLSAGQHAGVTAYAAAMGARLLALRVAAGRPLLVLFRAGGLGDVIATQPAVRALRAAHPGHVIVYVTRAEFAPLVRLWPEADHVIAARHSDHLWARARRWCDARRFCYGDEIPGAGSRRHFGLELAASVGAAEGGAPRLAVEPMPRAELARHFPALTGAGRVVAWHAGPTAAVRLWSEGAWVALEARLRAETGVETIRIEPGRLALPVLARALAACALVVGVDSGPLHLAAAAGARTVGIFGPVNPAWRLWPGGEGVALAPRLACQPCHHATVRTHWETGCPHGVACLRELPVEPVFAACRRALAGETP